MDWQPFGFKPRLVQHLSRSSSKIYASERFFERENKNFISVISILHVSITVKGDIRGDGLVAGPLDMCCSGQMWIQRRTDGLGFKRQPRTVQEQDEWRRL